MLTHAGESYRAEIIEFLQRAKYGEVVTYEAISKHIKADVQSPRYRGMMHDALRKLERQGVYFSNVRNVGYERITPEERVQKTRATERILKTTKSEIEALVCAPDGELTEAGRLRRDGSIMHMAAVRIEASHQKLIERQTTIRQLPDDHEQRRIVLKSIGVTID